MALTSLEIMIVDVPHSTQTPPPSMTKTLTPRSVITWLHQMVRWFFCCQSPPSDNICWNLCGEVKIAKVWVAKLPYVAIRRRFAILCLAWVILNLSVPRLRGKLLLGSKLWKWSILVALVSCGCHLCSQGTKILVYLLCTKKGFTKKTYMEFYVKGARRSVSFVLYSGWLLLTWVFYFRRRWGIKKTSEAEVILHIGTWTFVTLVVASLLCLFKTVLVLLWEVDTVYNRFKHRILKARSDIYFLAQICVPHLDIWDKNFGQDEQDEEMHKQSIAPNQEHCADEAEQDTKNKLKQREEHKDKAKRILFGDKATMNDIKLMSTYFVNFSKAARENDGTSDVLNKCRNLKPSVPAYNFTVEWLKVDDERKKLLKRLHANHGPEEILYEIFEKTMVKAHKNCLEIGRTLFDAKEVVKVLDRVWTGIVLVIAIIAWLLLTDIASTKMLILAASPFLAATFIFGDTCKRIFEGIIFSFVNHPFDVGDRCIIDKDELEVKRMSVLSTTFMAIGTKKEVLYPNSALASIPITNLRGEPDRNLKGPDPNDHVELPLDSAYTRTTKKEVLYPNSALASIPITNLRGEPDPNLKGPDPNDHVELPLDSAYNGTMLDERRKKIIRLFDAEKDKYEKEPSIVIKEICDGCIKMAIDFKQVMTTDETRMSPEEEEGEFGVVGSTSSTLPTKSIITKVVLSV